MIKSANKNPFNSVGNAYIDSQDFQENDDNREKVIHQKLISQLKQARKAKQLTQVDISKRTGLKTQNISRLEKGNMAPNLISLCRYAAALDGHFVFQFDTTSSPEPNEDSSNQKQVKQ